MFDLIHASSAIKKVAYIEGFRAGRHQAYFKPISSSQNEKEIRAIVGDNRGKEVEITIFDIEYIVQFTWEEIKAGNV